MCQPILTLYLLLCGGAAVATDAGGPVNFVVIMADDLGAAELGCYGHPSQKTPNLDKLAASGVKFETAFACPVCHPTRFEILTGQYGCHNGVYNFPGSRGGPEVHGEGPDNIANHVTFAQILKDAGYATAVAGKWQLSGSQPNLIRECGFDEYCVWGFRSYFAQEDSRQAKRAGIDFRSRYWHPSIVQNGKWVPTTTEDYGPDIFCEFLIDFMKRNKDRPFCAYYPMALTHGPWLPTPDDQPSLDAKSQKSRKNFRANVEYMDKIIGRLVSALEELGLRQRTILVFTADNGTGGDGKSQPTELGARVPLIVDGPGIVKQRGSTGELSDLSDILPTLVELGNATLPTDRPIDGVSLAPFLRGESESTRDWIFSYQADRRILRTKRWLLEDNSPLHPGKLFDCGTLRDGKGYQEVTPSESEEAKHAQDYFNKLIAKLPSPVLPREGKPNERKRDRSRRDD